ncbi:hypothetical protein WH47_12478 [Habropoda laboriosa]|uniref:Uncharacterized protein n=1 Tax=Habropoda laboriosa TaxID=597456 RepID=A0A0L7R045_9HYME|nr:hypothetical protein WH47_12478 [Habropoda laboriosa]
MDWMRRQDIKEESPETPTALTPDEPDECYCEEDTSIDEGMKEWNGRKWRAVDSRSSTLEKSTGGGYLLSSLDSIDYHGEIIADFGGQLEQGIGLLSRFRAWSIGTGFLLCLADA